MKRVSELRFPDHQFAVATIDGHTGHLQQGRALGRRWGSQWFLMCDCCGHARSLLYAGREPVTLTGEVRTVGDTKTVTETA